MSSKVTSVAPLMRAVTAGASAPEVLVEEVLSRLRERFDLGIEEVVVAEERITFKLPAALQPAPA